MALRRAANVYAAKSGFWIFREWRVYVARDRYYRFPGGAFERMTVADAPTLIASEPGRTLWMADGDFYWDTDDHTAEEVGLLLWDRARRHDAKLDRLRKMRDRADDVVADRRERIPDDVRASAWERDGGRCVRCGSDEALQFDHIIPVARGGGNGLENIQILCMDCNNRKSDAIA